MFQNACMDTQTLTLFQGNSNQSELSLPILLST